MGEAWSLYAWFGGITVIATAAGVLILDEPVSAALTFALAVGLAVAMQRDLFAWTHDGQL